MIYEFIFWDQIKSKVSSELVNDNIKILLIMRIYILTNLINEPVKMN